MINTKKFILTLSILFGLVFLSGCGSNIDSTTDGKDLTGDTEIIDKVDSIVDDIINDEVEVDNLDTGVLVDSDSGNLVESNDSMGMVNPASTNCIEKGGKLEIRNGTGGQYGICIFDNGKECEERAFFRGECTK